MRMRERLRKVELLPSMSWVSKVGSTMAKPVMTPKWSALHTRAKTESMENRTSYREVWNHVNQSIEKKPI